MDRKCCLNLQKSHVFETMSCCTVAAPLLLHVCFSLHFLWTLWISETGKTME